jgi:hypothetical protein
MMISRKPAHFGWNASLLALILVAMRCLIGCGEDSTRMPRVPVSGRVTIDGQPLAEATVVFLKKGGLADPNADAPRGVTDQDGRYQLSTYAENDGAPQGEYLVGIITAPNTEGLVKRDDPLKGRYANPETSSLTFTVPAEGSDQANFDLQAVK